MCLLNRRKHNVAESLALRGMDNFIEAAQLPTKHETFMADSTA